jgi:hypothetical protein
LRRKSGAGPNQPRLAGSIPNERCNPTFLIHSRLTLHGHGPEQAHQEEARPCPTGASLKPSLASGYQHRHALAWVAARQYRCRQNPAVAGTVSVTRLRPGAPAGSGEPKNLQRCFNYRLRPRAFSPLPPASGPRRRKAKTSDPAPGFLSSWFPRGGSRELKGGGHGSRWSAARCHHSW